MPRITSGRVASPHRLRKILLVVLPGCFSLLLSMAYADMAGQPGAMIARTTSDSIVAIWVVASLATVLGIIGVWALVQSYPRVRLIGRIASGVVAVCLLAGVILGPARIATESITTSASVNDQVRAAFLAVTPICAGQVGIAGAQPYGAVSHGMEVVLTTSDGSFADQQADATARAATFGPVPDALGNIQLVACIGPSTRVTLQTCDYTLGGSYTRYGYSIDVAVYAARTGERLDHAAFDGSSPDQCPDTKAVGDDQDEGGQVAWDDDRIWAYLQTWATGPGATAPAEGS